VPGDLGGSEPDAGQGSGIVLGLVAFVANPIAMVLWLVGYIGGSIIGRASA
jgi:hypothetical protein